MEELPEEEDEENQPPRKRVRSERPQDCYDIVEVNEKFVKKYQASTYDYRVQFRNMDHLSLREFLPRLGSIFESICAKRYSRVINVRRSSAIGCLDPKTP